MSDCIKTWQWKLPDVNCEVPRGLAPVYFCCRSCQHKEMALYRFEDDYEEENLLVCRHCGTANQVYYDAHYKQVNLRIWPRLYKQPFYWKYFNFPAFGPGYLAYDYILGSEKITSHPLIEAHGGLGEDAAKAVADSTFSVYRAFKKDQAAKEESAELMVRFLIDTLAEGFPWGYQFFNGPSDEVSIWQADGLLEISDGDPDAPFPVDSFARVREEADSLFVEYLIRRQVNIFGYTLDVNEEDYEEETTFVSCKMTFVGETPDELPEELKAELRAGFRCELSAGQPGGLSAGKPGGLRLIDGFPVMRGAKQRWITRNPFGLRGCFLFDTKREDS